MSTVPEDLAGASTAACKRQNLRVLVTGSGARGLAVGTMIWLRRSRSFDVKIVAVDASPTAVGRFVADRFYVVPRASNREYLTAIEAIIAAEHIDVVLPLLDAELPILSELKEKQNVAVASPTRLVVELCSDKGRLLSTLYREGLNPTPAFIALDPSDVREAVISMGYPERQIVAKPRRGSGARGIWLITERFDSETEIMGRSFMRSCTLSEFCVRAHDWLAEFVLAPFIEGEHYTVSCLNTKDTLVIVPIRREAFEPGITWAGEVVRHPAVIERVTQVVTRLKIGPCVNVQLVWDGENVVIYEINPRLSTTSTICAAAGINLADALLHFALGVSYIPDDVRWGLRFSRYAADLVGVE